MVLGVRVGQQLLPGSQEELILLPGSASHCIIPPAVFLGRGFSEILYSKWILVFS